MYYNKLNKDLEFGCNKEKELLQKLKTLDPDILFTKKFCCYDYESDNTIIELKSRRNKYNKYPTTMIGNNKIKNFLSLDKDVYLVFSFTDGIYYVKCDDELIKKCDICKGGRYDRGRPEVKEYCYIPINLLNPI